MGVRRLKPEHLNVLAGKCDTQVTLVRRRRSGHTPAMKLPALFALLLYSCVFAQAQDAPKPKEYPFGPDSERKEGVPQGKVTKQVWKSTVYPGTIREYFVYVPAQYDPQGS